MADQGLEHLKDAFQALMQLIVASMGNRSGIRLPNDEHLAQLL
jgi:hypothetical protein